MIEKVHEESRCSAHYIFMTIMSAGIAVLGLLLSSPAVVIGAMLISPLMGPIMGVGFALATFDSKELRRAAASLAIGVAIAVLLCAAIVLLSPIKTVTSEIASRTRPNLFDLLVALFSGLAGSYAMIRGRHGTIVGVAIATAIMPPLAVVGFGAATLNATVLAGAALLFFTNLMTIAITAAILARLYGFASGLSPRQTTLQAALIVIAMAALAVPLVVSLRQIAWEAIASRETRNLIETQFATDARVADVSIDLDSSPVQVDATVFTPHYDPKAEAVLSRRLRETLGRPVELSLDQFRVASGEEAEAVQVASARRPDKDGGRSRLVDRLALIAGVPSDQVLVDRERKTAMVTASPLPGADLATYRTLETRVGAAEPGWTVTLLPPLAAFPDVTLADGAPDAQGERALATAAWAAQRRHLGLAVAGPAKESAAMIEQLAVAGIEAHRANGGPRDRLRLSWLVPTPTEARAP